jgi:methyl-accepting chemotaxis protein
MPSKNSYLTTLNGRFLALLAAHVPVICGVAWYFGTGIGLAAGLGILFASGPAALFFMNRGSRVTSVALGISAMCFSALLIHASGGMIEMHFHIFTMLALMIAFQFPWPMVAAAVTIAVHHVAFFLWLPASLFNYHASFGIVLLHAFFVVFEVVPAIWLTHQFARFVSVQAETSDELAQATERVAGASLQVTEASQSLAGSAVRQSELLKTTVDVSKEISTLIRRTSEGAVKAASLTQDVKNDVEQGNLTLKDLAESLRNMSASSKKIQGVLKTIDDIAFQTNILALNAAVEAARAAEAGSGFAVVADEVRSLAQRSGSAARETAALVEESVGQSQQGEARLERAGKVFASITGNAEELNRFMEELRQVSKAGSTGIDDLSRTIMQIEADVEKTAAEATGSAQIGSQLSTEAERLQAVVVRLQAN